MIETILGHWLCLSIGAFFGFMIAAMLAAGKCTDEDMNRLRDLEEWEGLVGYDSFEDEL